MVVCDVYWLRCHELLWKEWDTGNTGQRGDDNDRDPKEVSACLSTQIPDIVTEEIVQFLPGDYCQLSSPCIHLSSPSSPQRIVS